MKRPDYIPESMRFKIKIEKPAVEINTSTGEWVDIWQPVSETFADMKVNFGGESIQSDKILAETTIEFIIRYIKGINERFRVTYQGLHYEIISIIDHGTNHYLSLQTILKR